MKTKSQALATAKENPSKFYAIELSFDGESLKKFRECETKGKAEFYAESYKNGWVLNGEEMYVVSK